MTLLGTRQIDKRFTKIKELARAGQPLSDEGLCSAADVAAYETVTQIYGDLHFRRMGARELTARGNLARAKYIQDKRDEILKEKIYKNALAAAKRSQESFSKLVHWTGADGDGAALLDVLQDYIHALTGEETPVTAQILCDVLRRELLAEPKKKPAQKAKKFTPPTLDEVRAYWTEKALKGDPEEFFDHFTGNGWKQANGNKLADWKAAARNWSRKEKKFSGNEGKGAIYSSDASYDLEAYRRSAIGLRDYEPKEATA